MRINQQSQVINYKCQAKSSNKLSCLGQLEITIENEEIIKIIRREKCLNQIDHSNLLDTAFSTAKIIAFDLNTEGKKLNFNKQI